MAIVEVVLSVLFAVQATGIDGTQVHLFDAQTRTPTALIFVRTDCPISNRYAPELKRIYQEFSGRITFYAVYPDAGETTAAIRKHTIEYSYPFQALRDPGHALVQRAKVSVTPEVAVFSPTGTLLYHGRIDNRYADFGKWLPQATTHDLEDALSAAVAGKPIRPDSTRAIGCSLADAR
jgi:AhpC/TSA family